MIARIEKNSVQYHFLVPRSGIDRHIAGLRTALRFVSPSYSKLKAESGRQTRLREEEKNISKYNVPAAFTPLACVTAALSERKLREDETSLGFFFSGNSRHTPLFASIMIQLMIVELRRPEGPPSGAPYPYREIKETHELIFSCYRGQR